MRIALASHVIGTGDGQGRVNYELARFLCEQEHDVHLLADRIDADLEAMGCTWHPIHPEVDTIDLIKYARFARLVDKRLDEIGDTFDVILGCGAAISRPHTVNAVHFVHGPWMDSPYHNARQQSGLDSLYQYAFSALNARWEKQSLSQARQVVAVSEMVRRELLEIGVPDEKIEVIVNGVDCHEFAPGAADRSALGLPAEPVLGLFAGDIKSPIKNLDTALRALVDVPAVHLAVAGRMDGSPYPSLADRLGIGHRVHFLGFRPDVADLMRAADLFLIPSRRDSCPLVLLEAIASGLPVIASRNVGNANLLSDAAGFVLDDPENAEALTGHLTALATDPSLRRSMSAAARSVAEQHSWDRMAERYLALFRRLVSSPVSA